MLVTIIVLPCNRGDLHSSSPLNAKLSRKEKRNIENFIYIRTTNLFAKLSPTSFTKNLDHFSRFNTHDLRADFLPSDQVPSLSLSSSTIHHL